MANKNLNKAKQAKNDEFYTQWEDIEREVFAYTDYNKDVFRGKTILLPCDDPEWSNFTKFFAKNFDRFGLRKLISTSYAADAKPEGVAYQPSLFETAAPHFDGNKTRTHGKIFTLERNANSEGRVDIDDLEWQYLDGDGDFRSAEVTALRDEADVIITNPPFSLFREFVVWLTATDKKFLILGNMNAITYKNIFPLIKKNKMWLGRTGNGSCEFRMPDAYPLTGKQTRQDDNGNKFVKVPAISWYTNLEHGKRHEPLRLMTMADNLKYNKSVIKKSDTAYKHYDNYDAIEVPFTDAIPCDYNGVMGVPISFLDKYCPEQFEVVGIAKRGAGDPCLKTRIYMHSDYPNYSDLNATPVIIVDGMPKNTYPRILIRHKKIE